jgi:hypothetical protein
VKSRKKVHLVIERKSDGTLIGTVVELPGVRAEAGDISGLRKAVRAEVERHMAERPESVAAGYAARYVGVEELLL